jgi:hypothetical protein
MLRFESQWIEKDEVCRKEEEYALLISLDARNAER